MIVQGTVLLLNPAPGPVDARLLAREVRARPPPRSIRNCPPPLGTYTLHTTFHTCVGERWQRRGVAEKVLPFNTAPAPADTRLLAREVSPGHEALHPTR